MLIICRKIMHFNSHYFLRHTNQCSHIRRRKKILTRTINPKIGKMLHFHFGSQFSTQITPRCELIKNNTFLKTAAYYSIPPLKDRSDHEPKFWKPRSKNSIYKRRSTPNYIFEFEQFFQESPQKNFPFPIFSVIKNLFIIFQKLSQDFRKINIFFMYLQRFFFNFQKYFNSKKSLSQLSLKIYLQNGSKNSLKYF